MSYYPALTGNIERPDYIREAYEAYRSDSRRSAFLKEIARLYSVATIKEIKFNNDGTTEIIYDRITVFSIELVTRLLKDYEQSKYPCLFPTT